MQCYCVDGRGEMVSQTLSSFFSLLPGNQRVVHLLSYFGFVDWGFVASEWSVLENLYVELFIKNRVSHAVFYLIKMNLSFHASNNQTPPKELFECFSLITGSKKSPKNGEL